MRPDSSLLTRFPFLQTGVVLMLTGILGWQALQVGTHYEMEDFFPEASPEREAFERARSSFGRDDRIALMLLESEGPLDVADFKAIDALTRRLEGLPTLEEVISPTSTEIPVRRFDDQVMIEPARPLDPERAAKALVAFAEPPYLDAVVNADQDVAAVAVVLRDDRVTHADRAELLDHLQREAERVRSETGLSVRLAGYPLQRVMLSDTINSEGRRLFPWVLAVILIVLALTLRRVVGVLLPLMVAGLAAVWTTGILAIIGLPLNMLGPAVYILIVVVGVSDSVHLISRHSELMSKGETPSAALKAALSDLVLPCFLTSATTGAGFAALVLTGIPLVADFGLQVAIGVMMAYFVTLLVLPPVIMLAAYLTGGKARPPKKTLVSRLLDGLDERVQRRPGAWFGGSLALLALAGVGVTQLQVNSPLLADLDPDHEIRQTNRFIEERFGGVIPLDIVIEPAPGGAYQSYTRERMTKIETLTTRLREMPEVLSATSAVDVLRQLAPALQNVPEEDIPMLLPTALLLAHDQVTRWVDDERDIMRVSLRIKDLDTAQAIALFDRIGGVYQSVMGEPIGERLTGQGYLAQTINNRLVEHFQLSAMVALGAVLFLLLLALRSVRLVLASLLPNLFPLVIVAGFMGLVGIDLRYTSALVLSVVFGLAVDDTIQFISQVKMAEHKGLADPIRRAYRTAGPGILLTSLILAAGFLVLVDSTFLTNRVMGILLALTAVAAVVADLVMLPALLRLLHKRTAERPVPAPAPKAVS